MTKTELLRSDFDYELPPELIAQHPAPQRRASRLLHLDALGQRHDRQFDDLPQLLRPHDLLVFNNTRVIKARLKGQKTTGGRVELLVERLLSPTQARVQLRASNPPKAEQQLLFAQGNSQATVLKRHPDGLYDLLFDQPILPLLDQYGELPLPPYISHQPTAEDEQRYQTVYASEAGAVAAPTAGLHFDEALLATLKQQGVQHAFVTLHVGAGTFQPVRTERLADHQMHAEHFVVPAATIAALQQARARGGRIIAVGTTSVRALETAALQLGQALHDAPLAPIEGDSRLFITPGYQFRWVDALLTNFHLPQSTLLMLVSALAGQQAIRAAYEHAIQARYRFFSYGDAMFIEPFATHLP